MTQIELKPLNKTYKSLETLDKINQEAFPETEIIPLDIFFMMEKEFPIELFAIEVEEEAVGFFVMYESEEFTFPMILAIDSNQRGKGYGSEVMKFIETFKKKNKPLFFFVESLDENAENYKQRLARVKLYERFNYKLFDKEIEFEGVTFSLMSENENIDEIFNEIEDLIVAFLAFYKKNIDEIKKIYKKYGIILNTEGYI